MGVVCGGSLDTGGAHGRADGRLRLELQALRRKASLVPRAAAHARAPVAPFGTHGAVEKLGVYVGGLVDMCAHNARAGAFRPRSAFSGGQLGAARAKCER